MNSGIINVLKPAGLFQEDLSKPIIPAKKNPSINFKIAWNQNDDIMFKIISIKSPPKI